MLRKILNLSLVLYLLILLTQPCQDALALLPGSGSSAVAVVRSDDTPDYDGETCSPFCICSCCSLSTAGGTLTIVVISETISSSISSSVAARYLTYAEIFQPTIWQPPKA